MNSNYENRNFEFQINELDGLMKHNFSFQDRDNTEYVTDIGRRLNHFLENMVKTPLEIHKEFVNELEILFRSIKHEYLDDVDLDQEYIEYPRIVVQLKHIREMIRNFLSTTGGVYFVLKFKYRFAKQALIQLYFMAHEIDNSDLWNLVNIHDYERPVTFYEYEIDSLVESMEEM